MFELLTFPLAMLLAALRDRSDLLRENLQMRHQLAVLTRPNRRRPRRRTRDKLLRVLARRLRRDWQRHLFLVRLETGVRCAVFRASDGARRFDDVVARVREGAPPGAMPEEIEAEITAARAEYRAVRVRSGRGTRGRRWGRSLTPTSGSRPSSTPRVRRRIAVRIV